MKLTYTLEVEVPDDVTAVDFRNYLDGVKFALKFNEHLGWKAKLTRFFGFVKPKAYSPFERVPFQKVSEKDLETLRGAAEPVKVEEA